MRQTLGFGRKRHVVSEDSGQIGIVVARREEPLALELQLDRLEDGVRHALPLIIPPDDHPDIAALLHRHRSRHLIELPSNSIDVSATYQRLKHLFRKLAQRRRRNVGVRHHDIVDAFRPAIRLEQAVVLR